MGRSDEKRGKESGQTCGGKEERSKADAHIEKSTRLVTRTKSFPLLSISVHFSVSLDVNVRQTHPRLRRGGGHLKKSHEQRVRRFDRLTERSDSAEAAQREARSGIQRKGHRDKQCRSALKRLPPETS